MTTFSEQIGVLIGKDDLKGAIKSLHKMLKNSPKLDEAIMQSARFTELSKQIRLGIIDFEQADFTKNKIRYAIIDLVRDMEEICESNSEINREVSKNIENTIQPKFIQTHYGKGDIIGGDKNVNY